MERSTDGYTVSPLRADFYDFVDADMKGIIKALRDKGYLTYSCCAGHTANDRAFFSVAFPTLDLALEFVMNFMGKNGLVNRSWARACNQDKDIKHEDKNGKVVGVNHRRRPDRAAVTEMLNKAYGKGYEDYYLAEVEIIPKGFSKSMLTHISRNMFMRNMKLATVEDYIKKEVPVYVG